VPARALVRIYRARTHPTNSKTRERQEYPAPRGNAPNRAEPRRGNAAASVTPKAIHRPSACVGRKCTLPSDTRSTPCRLTRLARRRLCDGNNSKQQQTHEGLAITAPTNPTIEQPPNLHPTVTPRTRRARLVQIDTSHVKSPHRDGCRTDKWTTINPRAEEIRGR